MNAEIQIQFLRPGDWQEFALTAIYRDADGYTCTGRYTQEDLPLTRPRLWPPSWPRWLGWRNRGRRRRCGRGWGM